MCRKSICLISVVLVLGSVSDAAEIFWSDGAADHNHLWTDPDNWEGGVVPGPGDEVQILSPEADAGHGPIIQDGMDITLAGLKNELAGRPGKPELTMTGGNLELTDFVWWGDYDDIEAFWYHSGGNVTVANEFELGWGPDTGGAGTLDMTGGTITAGELVIPTGSGAYGEFYLRGGTFNVRASGGLEINANGLVDVSGGTLVLEGDQTATVEGFINAGQIIAYGGAGLIELDYDRRNPGKTTLTAVWGGEGKAYKPDPPDGALNPTTFATLGWKPGDFAASHTVYLGDNFDDVNDGTGGTFLDNTGDTFLFVGFLGYPLPEGLVPGTTYYWRVDEVNDMDPNSPWKGDVWSFRVPPKKAYDPVPGDAAKFIDPDVTLSWTGGHLAALHTVYFGDDFDVVNNAAGGTGRPLTTYTPPGPLEPDKTYYWRVDEWDQVMTYEGDVWSFMTARAGGGLRGDYYHWTGDFPPQFPFQTFVVSRTDPQINWNWGDGNVRGTNSPHPMVNVNDFACRWVGEVEAAFTETYTFYTTTDDGARLWVDGREIIDNAWRQQGMTEWSGTIDLVAGQWYSIEMWMYDHQEGAGAELRWSSPRTPKQVIPQAALSPPIKANRPSPHNGAIGTKMTPVLRWNAGDYAAEHQVYFGTDEDAVKNATTGSSEHKVTKALGDESFGPSKLAWDSAYFWRVDEVNDLHPDSPWVGSVWSFATGDFLVVDNIEDYDVDNAIWANWRDGLGYVDGQGVSHPGNGTGSEIGDANSVSYTEESIVNSGRKSMPYWYNNNKADKWKYSEAKLTLSDTRNWTEEGVKALSLWFYGDPANVPEQMYLAVANNAGAPAVVPYAGDADDLTKAAWQEWNIDLSQFSGISLADVNSVAIGFGDRNNPQAGGAGKMYFDDIRLYRSRCVPDEVTLSQADLNSDCVVDLRDLEIMVGDWLAGDPGLAADLNADDTVDFKDYAVLADQWLDEQVWPQ
jgi:hypothetical protein